MSHATITPEVEAVVRRSTIVQNRLTLPGHLARPLYEAVNKVLVNCGGKWNRSAQAHVFESDPMTKLGLALETGSARDEKKDRQAFYTPKDLARRIVEMADVKGRTVLEPSSGDGALALACREAGAATVLCVEIDAVAADKCKAHGFPVMNLDFLKVGTMPKKFDRVVMNPPFTKNQDVKHVAHALQFLGTGGVLVSVMMTTVDRTAFKALVSGRDYEIEEVEAGAFAESGTNVSTIILKVRA